MGNRALHLLPSKDCLRRQTVSVTMSLCCCGLPRDMANVLNDVVSLRSYRAYHLAAYGNLCCNHHFRRMKRAEPAAGKHRSISQTVLAWNGERGIWYSGKRLDTGLPYNHNGHLEACSRQNGWGGDSSNLPLGETIMVLPPLSSRRNVAP